MGHSRRYYGGAGPRNITQVKVDLLGGVVENEGKSAKRTIPQKGANSASARASANRKGSRKLHKSELSDSESTPKCVPAKPAEPATKNTSAKGPKPLPKPELSEKDLLEAVASLYADQLKPFGRILRKRLGERGVGAGLATGEAGLAQLRTICGESSRLSIESEQGGDWTALIIGELPDFVDIYSPEDVYPVDLWTEATIYFESLQGEILPGGRFSCAQCLVDRKLPFLAGRSLGQVCHIVQLAISQKKMLGYSSGGITPYANSQSMLKDKAAAQQSACAGAGGAAVGELPLATWVIAREHLRSILKKSMQEGANSVPLSNIKRVFRSHYQTELSETALGHSKLSELLQDARLDDTCTVELHDQGYFVIPRFSLEEDCTASDDLLCSDIHLCLEEALSPPDAAVGGGRWFPYSPFALHQDGNAGSMVRNTFIHTGSATRLGARTRSQSVAKDFGSRRCDLEASCHSLEFMPEPAKSVELQIPPTPAMQALNTASPLWSWTDEHSGSQSDDSQHFQFSVGCADEIHQWNSRPRSQSLAKNFGSKRCEMETLIPCGMVEFQQDCPKKLELQLPPTPAMPALKTASPVWTWPEFGSQPQVGSHCDTDNTRFKFCVDEPLCVDELLCVEDTHDSDSNLIHCDPAFQASPVINVHRQVFRLSDHL